MKKFLLVFSVLLLGASALLAQRTLTGTIKDDEGEGLIGASVVVKGTNVGTTTDVTGAFSLDVPADATTLVVSYTGFETQEVEIGASNVVDISMQTSQVGLDEVIVVGYGTQQKRNVTGNISTVKGSELTNIAVQSFDQALVGRAAGVNISLPNGVLNNPPVIRVRGINSINLSSFPLVVIDGIPTFTGDQSGTNAANNPLANLNPADIESIDILKDASAAAIYGSRASAGVVLITTKRGKSGKTRVAYDGWTGWTEPTRLFDLLNAQEYVAIKNEAAANAGLTPRFFLDTLNGQLVDTDWYDYVYQTGFSQNHSLNFSGGTDVTNFFVSLGYTDQEGMIKRNTFERLSGRLNLDHKVGKLLGLGATVNYSNSTNAAPNTGSVNSQTSNQSFGIAGLGRLPLVQPPNLSPVRTDGSYSITSANTIAPGKNLISSNYYNPLPILDLNEFTSESDLIQASVYGQINLFKGLYFRTQYGINNVTTEDITFQTAIHGDGFGQQGLAQNLSRRSNRWNWQNILNYDLNIAEKHSFNFLAGNEQQYTTDERWGATRTVLADPLFETFQGNYTTINPAGNFQGENYLLSYFGRINYSFNNRYQLSVNLRSDEYSAFAVGEKQGIFWGASLGYAISEEGFWKNIFGNTFNYFRLRGSYGEVGNFNGIGNFASFSLYGSGLYGPDATVSFNQVGNTALTWETSKKTDLGLNFGLFNDRLQGEVTYFTNLVDGLILDAPQSPSKGIPGNTIATNVGSMENRGIEIGLTGTIVRGPKVTWTSNFNISFVENEILELAGGDIQGITGLEAANITRVGQSVGSLYVVETRGVNPATGRRIFVNSKGEEIQYKHTVPTGQSRWTYLDGRPAAAVTVAADGKVYGPTLPTWFGAWDNTVRFFNFDVNLQVQYSGGNYVYNGTQAGLRDMRFWNNHTDVLNRWQREGDVTNIPRVELNDNVSNGSSFPISENVEKGDFLRVRNIALGYTLPNSLFGNKVSISNLRIYGAVNNAFILTNYSGTDPEVSTNGNSNIAPGVDRNSVGIGRTYTVGLNLGF
jgi:TonB-linked SusC/RagA family outer membrane protein